SRSKAARHEERGCLPGGGGGGGSLSNRETNTPKKKESKVSMSKNSKPLSMSAKRIQKQLAEITLDPPPNCSAAMFKTVISSAILAEMQYREE
uniref:Uncharacterized protein n=1 Tax=Phocoena sinus TaxID=42100 RepID=A0A8C9EFC3_PHOSS